MAPFVFRPSTQVIKKQKLGEIFFAAKFSLELISGGQVAGHFVSDDGLAAGWESPLGQAVASVVGRSSEALRGAIRLCCWDRWAKRVGTGGQALTHTGKSLPIPTPIVDTIIVTCRKGAKRPLLHLIEATFFLYLQLHRVLFLYASLYKVRWLSA